MFKYQRISVLNLLLALLLSVLVGCAGSKPPTDETIEAADPDDYAEIERILGISSPDDQAVTTEDNTNDNSSSDEDELLSLLQPQDNTSNDNTTSGDSGNNNDGLISRDQISSGADARVDRLLNEVAQLNDSVRDKNKTIADLKARIMIMEADAKEQQPSLTVSTPVERDYIPRVAGSSLNDSEYESEYNRAKQLYLSGSRGEAQQVFESLLAANSRHPLADNAQYWMGECHFARGDYRAAIIAFEKVFTYSKSNKNDFAQYMLGKCYYRLKDLDRSRQEFQTLLDNYKNSQMVAKAENFLRDKL